MSQPPLRISLTPSEVHADCAQPTDGEIKTWGGGTQAEVRLRSVWFFLQPKNEFQREDEV
jgi:hypothetical protein